MRIDVFVLGKLKDFAQIANEYVKMLSQFHEVKLLELGHENIEDTSSLKRDSAKVLRMLRDDDHLILLDEHGKDFDSISFAHHISELIMTRGKLVFLVGGPLGVDDSLKKRANERISLSKLTLTHRIATIVLLEQLFRSFKILSNQKYHY
ncbi:50S rRNA methyltransferase [Pseudothermotoga hypogea DSM 11164 = NBRC 106472]|uniref:Ribosomal RNA large subunit methyltransferase H n=1 Tax=Pseudothermotoga hypogea DSM 11164 = NBRC 106472 TaxID=1123384 RepID=A0A0X1KT16_9THEM|nr:MULTISPECIES: 23S rRNA (pseudouridine(1915)-N(3))-methyltransferase RlmH [Pseudothermotoga]AJC74439.1 50S rRNA methyltransferase [Pseudothermotoga hypogea DSM 11164 = NBRC 106472]MBC7121677.1 23S rRNA (pseudouridine(1915)-N(3))-methyltransferase RlmH [Pseudothermotoga sp.]MDI6861950.1 23S rRNA (pseudouridine(1915)-N(3))-methyltransferase RlmH [Pseudothermotoga sp.]